MQTVPSVPSSMQARLRASGPSLIAVAGAVLGLFVYERLPALAAALAAWLPFAPDSRAGAAIGFFLYEVPKVLLLLCAVVFVMGIVRSYCSPERTRALLAGRRGGLGNALAAALGVVTPFCSCSAVPVAAATAACTRAQRSRAWAPCPTCRRSTPVIPSSDVRTRSTCCS